MRPPFSPKRLVWFAGFLLLIGAIALWLLHPGVAPHAPDADSPTPEQQVSTDTTASPSEPPTSTAPPQPRVAQAPQPALEPLPQEDPRWPQVPIMAESATEIDVFGTVVRQRTLKPADLPWPVKIEEHFWRDPESGKWTRLNRTEINATRFAVKLADSASLDDLEAAAAHYGARVTRELTTLGHYEITIPEANAADIESYIAALDASGVTTYAEPSAIVHTFATPDDPRFLDGALWGLHNTGQNDGTADADIDAPEGWAIRTSAANIIVGVVDTGVLSTHQDLAANMWANPTETLNGADSDANGWIDDIHGIDSINNDGDSTDDNGHGSHVAGTIAAVGNNTTGVVGVAWDAQIMGLKFLSAAGSGDTNDAVACITYAIQKQARVLNNSWGGNSALNTLRDVIQAADAAGIVFVVAAGNSSDNLNIVDVFPANYRLPNIVTVAATDRNDDLATFSNFSSASVHLAAPGVTIRSAHHTSDSAYTDLSGTSMAAPHVAGALALLAAEFPGETPRQLINRLLTGGDAIPAADTTTASGRRLNLHGSLTTTHNRPFHDDFASSRIVSGSAVALETWTTGATAEVGEPVHVDGQPVGPSVWWTWTAPDSGVTVFSTENTAFDTLAAAYTGTTLGNLVRIASNDDSPVGGTSGSRLTFTAQAGTTYHFAISGKSGATGLVRAFLSGPPPNDDFANATLMTGGTVSGTNINATKESGEPNHADISGGWSVWWKITPATAGKLAAVTHGSAFDTVLAVYRTQAANPTFADLQLVGSNNNADDTRTTSRVAFTAELGWTYYFAIDSASGLTGAVTLTVATPPINDDFADRSPILGSIYPIVRTGHNTQASREPGEPTHAGTGFGRSLWWTWTAPETRRYEVRTEDSFASTVLAVYTGTAVDSLSLVGANQAAGGPNNSIVSFNATAGTAYHFAIDDTGFFHGSVRLVLDESLLGPNDRWQDAITLTGHSDTDTQGNTGATRQSGEPGNDGGNWSNTIWWKWTAPATGAYAIDTAGSTFATMLRVATGNAVNALTTVGVDEFQRGPGKTSHIVFNATQGTTYYFQVAGLELQSGLVTINLNPWTPHANDDFANAEDISSGVYRHLRPNYGATKEPGEPAHQNTPGGASIWFSYTPAPGQGGRSVASTYGSGFPAIIAVYTGTDLNNLTPVTNLMPEGHHYGKTEILWDAQVGTTYYVALDVPGTGGALTGGDFALTLGPVATNDNFATSTVLAGSTTTDTAHNFGASKEPGEPNHKPAAEGGKSLWWSWTCPATGVYQIDTIGSRSPLPHEPTTPNFLAVYTGSTVNALTLLARGEAIGVDPEFYNQKLVGTFTAGTTYHIAVDGTNFWETFGGPAYDTTALGITLNIAPFPVAENNDFANAIEITGDSPRVVSSTIGASKESGEPNHGGMNGGRSLWWTWTAPDTATYYAHVGELYDDFRSSDTAVAIYTGNAVNALTLIAQDRGSAQNGHSIVGFNAVAGTTYRIAVDSDTSAEAGNVVLSLRKAPDHDHFPDARQMTGYSWIDESHNIGATRESGEPSLTTWYQGYPGEPQHRRTVWWSWTAPVSGPVAIETLGSQIFNILAVFTGNDLNNLTEIVKHIALDPLNNAQGQTRDYRGTARVSFNAVAGTTYRITVAGQGWATASAGTIRIELTGPDAPPMPPAAPTNLQATATSPTTIGLSWTDNASTETGFVVERATSGSGPWTVIANPSADATSAISHSLTPGTTYHFRVKAVNAGGDSAYTATVSASTATGPLASDGFNSTDYPSVNVNLTGLNPARPGWSGAWFSSTGNFLVRDANHGGSTLDYTDGTRTLQGNGTHKIGNSANARTGRLLDTTPTGPFAPWRSGEEIGADGQTLYLSFLMKIEANGFNALELHRVSSSDKNRRFHLGRNASTSTTNFIVNANGSTATLGTLNTDANLFVVKIEFGAGTTAGNERVTVWHNPTDLSGEGSNTPAAILTNVPNFTFDRMHLAGFSSGTSYFDEIRFGHAWSAVTPHTGGEPELTPLEQWLTTAGLPLDTDLTLDPSGGGVPLLLRYALGLNPSGDVSASLPQLQVSGLSPQPSYLTLSFTPEVVADLTYTIEASSDLSDWSETTDITALLTPGEPYTFTDSEPTTDNPRRFLRLRVQLP